MQWYHECDIAWLRARANYLTATDIKELLPVTKTGRKRAVTKEQFISVYARKMKFLTQEDCASTGAAARGHILEPYAVNFFNEHASIDHGVRLYHWDDVVLPETDTTEIVLAFSPDACDINRELLGCVDMLSRPRVIGEIKSYSPSKHMTLGFTDKKELEERWQIATAMACRDSIERGLLILYNPSMTYQMFVKEYDRDSLKKELEIISEIREQWAEFFPVGFHDLVPELEKNTLYEGNKSEESFIVQHLESQKSVIQR